MEVQKLNQEEQKCDEFKRIFPEWDVLKEQITYRLISKEKNKELLLEVPYEEFLDLALIYQWTLKEEKGIQGTVILRKEHLECLGVSENDVREAARKTTPQFCPSAIYELKVMLQKLCGVEGAGTKLPDSKMPDLYVLTNKTGIFGAAALTYEEDLKQFAKRCGGSYYVLPSSIHEIIFIPDDGKTEVQELSEMVKDVNKTEVSERDFLSDSVYYYDAAIEKLRRVM